MNSRKADADSSIVRVMTIGREIYALRLAAAVRSMIDNLAADRLLTIKIVEDGMSEQTKDRLLRSWDLSRVDIEWVDAELDGQAALPEVQGLAPVYLARLFCTRYVPDDWGRLICLDPDVLVLTDLGRLWDLPMHNHYALATVDPFIPTVSNPDGLSAWRDIGLPRDAPFLNAAVTLLDLKRLRDDGLRDATIDFLERFGDTCRFAQDVMNATLYGKWGELDPRWQVHPRILNRPRLARRVLDSESLGKVSDDPWIYHFGGRLKPWDYRAKQHADDSFFEYLDRTEWRGWRPSSTTLKNALYRAYDSPLRDWLHPLEVRLLAGYRALKNAMRR